MLRRNHQIPLAAARSRRRAKLLRIVRPSRPQREILESHRDAAIIPLINDTLRFGWVARRRHRLSASSRRTRLCEKSVVQSACRTSVSVSSIRKSIALATSVRRRQLRKRFCASLAHATFHTAWFAGTTSGYFPSHRQRLHAHLAQPLWLTTLTMIPWGSLTKNRRTPHG